MEWRFYISPLTVSTFSYVSFDSVLNIYIYIFALLYLPQNLQTAKRFLFIDFILNLNLFIYIAQKFKENDNDIMRDVYGEEIHDQERELDIIENKEEETTKKVDIHHRLN